MKKNYWKTLFGRILSIILIIALMIPVTSVADENEEVTTPVTSVESQNDTEVKGLGYTEEQIESYLNCGFDINAYEAFLAEIDVQIVNGDIIVETADQFRAIAQYKKEYEAEVGIDYAQRVANTILLSYNVSLLSEQSDLVYGVLDKNQAIYPFPFQNGVVYKAFSLALGSQYENAAAVGKSHNSETYRVLSPFIFDKKLRDDVAVIEEAALYYALTSIPNTKEEIAAYLERQENLLSFYLGEESSFPYALDELPDGASATIYYVLCNTSMITISGIDLASFTNALFNDNETSKSFNTVQPLIEAFDDYLANANN